MSDCQRCSQFPDLESNGSLLFYSKNSGLQANLKKDEIARLSDGISEEDRIVSINYSSYNQIDQILNRVNQLFTIDQKKALLGSYSSSDNQEQFINMAPFQQFYERLQNRDYLTIINQRLFTQHLQPIVKLQKNNAEIFGYEFLVRQSTPSYPFFPSELFSYSQKAGLQANLDSQARISSIELSSKLLKNGTKRFINFLPSSIYDPAHCLKSTFRAVEQFGVDPADLVFEVVETEKIDDINHLKSIFKTYQENGIKLALDDLGAGFSTLDVLKELKPNFAKIDRNLIDYCDQYNVKQEKIKQIVQLAEDYNITLLAEGIERKEEAEFCMDLGIPLAQGYYFGKPQAKPLQQDLKLMKM
ncbi:EAL domain-containing protein [Halalkalibacter akibai]|uniref:Diguanylate phosphodiesterase n=1 Tax=Halalkalibacter akibai (strain ATCC 43226 / DSM 21942 / CIP 109018 / JCM 9157 / 1139) TaxID=1236973 RepID=W4QVP5_HALA3|nr:EAL domain-containing protein [Halalkalibacter akibai]GAE35389.1 diguanylate phosphodiesterase [Halalkalibacter akibai JCM 9157]